MAAYKDPLSVIKMGKRIEDVFNYPQISKNETLVGIAVNYYGGDIFIIAPVIRDQDTFNMYCRGNIIGYNAKVEFLYLLNKHEADKILDGPAAFCYISERLPNSIEDIKIDSGKHIINVDVMFRGKNSDAPKISYYISEIFKPDETKLISVSDNNTLHIYKPCNPWNRPKIFDIYLN